MKKLNCSLLLICAMVIMSSTVFTSCDKDESNPSKKILMNEEWVMSSIETEDELLKELFDFSYMVVKTTYEFKKNDKYTKTSKPFLIPATVEEGTWSISDDGKVITIDSASSEIIELTSTRFKMGPNTEIMGEGSDYVLVLLAK